ncbi:MAG: hypothetical protein CMC76_05940 [Flavobacteriaceae bacterium]|nr:hypothetical protein [Flavobacteriaceae bacterium]|tara:strand:- start:604 stop:1218 length:615 start_codon:yes stop_codon:yes gene_type:complete
MKQILLLILFCTGIISCKAQIIEEPIYSSENYGEDGYYFKDTDNDFNQFEGTWIYTNGIDSLEIQFEKKTMMHVQDSSFNYYEDAIVGEYRFIENGVEIVNTLPNLQDNYSSPYSYNISGGSIHKYGDPRCGNLCNPNDIVVICTFADPEREISGMEATFYMRHFLDDGVEKLEVYLSSGGNLDADNEYFNFRLPFGEYLLVKQ